MSEEQLVGARLGTTIARNAATTYSFRVMEYHRKRVRFFSTVELVNAPEQEKLQGKPGQIAARLSYSDLVILNEPGYPPFRASGGALLSI